MHRFGFGSSRKDSSTAFSLKERGMPSASRKTTGAKKPRGGGIIRSIGAQTDPPGEGVQAVRKRVTSAQSLVDRATSSKSPASSS